MLWSHKTRRPAQWVRSSFVAFLGIVLKANKHQNLSILRLPISQASILAQFGKPLDRLVGYPPKLATIALSNYHSHPHLLAFWSGPIFSRDLLLKSLPSDLQISRIRPSWCGYVFSKCYTISPTALPPSSTSFSLPLNSYYILKHFQCLSFGSNWFMVPFDSPSLSHDYNSPDPPLSTGRILSFMRIWCLSPKRCRPNLIWSNALPANISKWDFSWNKIK